MHLVGVQILTNIGSGQARKRELDARLALNNSFFLHRLNHKSVLNDKPLNPERIQTLDAIIGAQLVSLANLKTYVTPRAQGMHSGGSTGGFVWFVTDTLGRLGVVAIYGAAHRRLRGPYGAEPASLVVTVAIVRSHTGTSARALDERTASAHRPVNVRSDLTLSASDAGARTGSARMHGPSEAPAALDTLGHTLYPLFCMSVHSCRIWRGA
ncbi:hypothetical protein V8E53_002207 [Lactarius tabidus]